MSLFLNLASQGLINGAVYALIAIGLAMVFGLLRILHIAHAGLFALGGYLGLVVTNATGSFALGLAVSMAVVAACGVLMYRLCYEPILEQPPYVPLIASVGMFLAIEELLRLVFGDHGLSYHVPSTWAACASSTRRSRWWSWPACCWAAWRCSPHAPASAWPGAPR